VDRRASLLTIGGYGVLGAGASMTYAFARVRRLHYACHPCAYTAMRRDSPKASFKTDDAKVNAFTHFTGAFVATTTLVAIQRIPS
jgi:hypothetical protein